MSGEPKTLTQMTPREAWETAWEQAIDTARVVMEEETVAKQLEAMRNLSRQFIDQEPEGVPVVARDDAAELRAAVREYRHARDWYRYAWGTPDENGAHGRLAAADEALHRLAASEGQP